ncbi:MAG: MarR family transcriptional regulator [Acidimicrobiales bacterium]
MSARTIAEGDLPGRARLTYLVKQLERAIRVAMDDVTRAYDLTAIQYTALSVLVRNRGMSSAQLARRSFVSPQACYEMIVILEGKGLVERKPLAGNRRTLQIEVTKAGVSVLKKCDRHMDQLEQRIFGVLSTTERQSFRNDLVECISSQYPEIRHRL